MSVVIVLASIVAVIALAGRVYANGALHLRGQMKLRNALRAAKSRERAVPCGLTWEWPPMTVPAG